MSIEFLKTNYEKIDYLSDLLTDVATGGGEYARLSDA